MLRQYHYTVRFLNSTFFTRTCRMDKVDFVLLNNFMNCKWFTVIIFSKAVASTGAKKRAQLVQCCVCTFSVSSYWISIFNFFLWCMWASECEGFALVFYACKGVSKPLLQIQF
mmetsp:Transcript_97185/g.222658  ORF Transcript_97185/g.222658 Transcript_97185/m.222658 type:complete len:113 (-) Transcript_97185:858-1196(-)